MDRYERQLQIAEWDTESQDRLSKSRITVVGAGGLGSPVLYYLAAAGAGNLHLIDSDRVQISNLNRQILYTERDVGRMKAEAAAQRLSELNAEINITFSTEELDAANVSGLIPASDLLIDCLDNFKTRFILNKYAVTRGVPLIHAGVHGFSGQLTTIIPKTTPCLECLFSELKDPTDKSGHKLSTPVVGAVVGVMGGLQAVEAIKVITGIGTPYTGRLAVYDGLQGSLSEMQVERNRHCCVCANDPL